MRKTICICDNCKKEINDDRKVCCLGCQAFDLCSECSKEMENFKEEIEMARNEYIEKQKEIIKKYKFDSIVRTDE